MKSSLSLSLLLGLALSQVGASCPESCPDTEDVVWALGGGCNVFRNKCYFDKANCQPNYELTITTKEECQKQCADICGAVYQPTGGIYKGQLRKFSNECEKLVHTCRTGERKCPDTEEVVWALGGGCSVFRNKCYFDKENCHRKPALTITTKRECQRHCPDICTAVYQPTSGIYNGKVLNFGNECEKRAYTCRTGQSKLNYVF
uniref:GG22213 n=1 Tax=Drosophila erecta TaxID=7220 RepID=B3P3E2_DROER